jgi:surface antigen
VNVAKGLNGVLGAPTSAEQGVGNGLVKQEFENGYITWKDGMAQAYNQDGGLLFQRPAYTPPSFRAGGGSNSGALLSTVDRDYFLQRPEFYTTGNIFAQSGFGSSLVSGTGSTEGNCTWYAHGRVMEMGGDPAALRSMRGNANQWHLQMSNGTRVLNAGEQPQIGDIAQWTRSGMNHVAVVEDVYDKGGQTYIKISESHYNTNFDGGANGTLHSVKEYTEGNPDRFIRVPGVSQGVESLSTAKAPSQKGSYEENFDARIYEDGSDIPTHNPELSIRQEGWDGSQHIQNSNETLYRVEVPNSKLESIGNFFSGLIGSSPKNEKEYIFTTSNYIYIDKLEQEAHKDGSVSISMKAYNPHPVDALIEIYDDKGQLVDIASKQISASKLPESLLDGFLDATLRYSTEDLGRGFTDIRNNTSPTELDVDLKPGQRLDISINSDAATLVNTIALVIDAVKYSPELFRSISPTFMDQVVESMDSFRIVEAAKMILMKEGLEIVRDSVIHSSKESTDWKDFLSSEGFKNLLSYLMSDVYKDMSFGISKHALEKAIDQGVMKLNPALGKIQESLYSITKSLNIVNRFTTMQKALDSNIESASFQIVPGSDQ